MEKKSLKMFNKLHVDPTEKNDLQIFLFIFSETKFLQRQNIQYRMRIDYLCLKKL